MIRSFVLCVFAALTLPAALVAQSADAEAFIQIGAGAAPETPAFGAAAGVRVPVTSRFQLTGRVLGFSAFTGGCVQSFPESVRCDISGYGVAVGLRASLPEVGPMRPFVEFSGGGFRSGGDYETSIDPHAALEAGISFGVTSSIQGSLAARHFRVFGSHYEELLDESLTNTSAVLGIAISISN